VRNREAFGSTWEDMPVFGTSAASFDDDGVTALYLYLRDALAEKGLPVGEGELAPVATKISTGLWTAIPADRVRYLAEIAETVRGYHAQTEKLVDIARRRALYDQAVAALGRADDAALTALAAVRDEADAALDSNTRSALDGWSELAASYEGDEQVVLVRDQEIHTPLRRKTLSGNTISRVAVPKLDEVGALLRYLRRENLPGHFPYTAGVFPFKRDGEDPARMFAGEGDAFRTNRRFHLVSEGQPATRLSTAFDSVTL
jgi:methylmalonyl-CoA mutase